MKKTLVALVLSYLASYGIILPVILVALREFLAAFILLIVSGVSFVLLKKNADKQKLDPIDKNGMSFVRIVLFTLIAFSIAGWLFAIFSLRPNRPEKWRIAKKILIVATTPYIMLIGAPLFFLLFTNGE